MHKQQKMGLGFGFAVTAALVLVAIPAFAEAPPAVPAAGSTLEQRVAQRKAERTVTVAEKDKQRLSTTCTNAQAKMRTLQQTNSTVIENRIKKYQQIDAKLWVAIGKLKIAEKDTFNLEKQRAALAEKTNAFQVTSQAYKQVLDDTVVINCKADPEGFMALLGTVRLYRTQIREQIKDINNYTVNDIKNSVSGLATELRTKPSTEEGR